MRRLWLTLVPALFGGTPVFCAPVPSFWVANEIESEHVSIGRLKVANPAWNIDLGGKLDFAEWGYVVSGLWTESDICDSPDTRKWYFHELDPVVAYGYRWPFADGWAFDARLGAQWNYMSGHYGDARRSYDEWQPRAELKTPWMTLWYSMRNFYWPVAKASFRFGVNRSFPIVGRLSFNPCLWFDGGSARWNRQRFGYRDADSIGSGVNSFSAQLFLAYSLCDGLSLYGGVMPYVVIDPAVRSELRANPDRTAKTETVVFATGVLYRF